MSKKLIVLALIFGFNVLPVANCYAAVSNLDSMQIVQLKNNYSGKKMLVIGDSIGNGYRLNSPSEAYGKLLCDKLNMNYKNTAVNGTTTKELLDRINNEDLQNIKNADVVNISVGGNDIMLPLLDLINKNTNFSDKHDNYGDVLDKYETFCNDMANGKYDNTIINDLENGTQSVNKYFPQILKRIKEINPNAKIITQTISNPLKGIAMLKHVSDIVDSYIVKINDCIKQNSNNNGNVANADIYDSLKDEGGFDITNMSDFDIHPNKKGHYDIYLCIYKLLTCEYPNDIKVNIDGVSSRLEYNENALSPTIFLKPKEGYRLPIYIDVTSPGEYGMAKTEKMPNGEYKIVLMPHQLSEGTTLTGKLVKLESNSYKNNTDADEKVNSSSDNFNNNILESTSTPVEKGKKFITSDLLYRFIVIFIACFTFVIYKILRRNFRKE